jgi:hypothetical protein
MARPLIPVKSSQLLTMGQIDHLTVACQDGSKITLRGRSLGIWILEQQQMIEVVCTDAQEQQVSSLLDKALADYKGTDA